MAEATRSEILLNVYFPHELSLLILDLAKVTDTEKLAWLFQQSDDLIKELTKCTFMPMEVQIDDGDRPYVLLVRHRMSETLRVSLVDYYGRYLESKDCTLDQLTPDGCNALFQNLCSTWQYAGKMSDFCRCYKVSMHLILARVLPQ